jgi:RimJ/RimL family protein N-acetyltransferase
MAKKSVPHPMLTSWRLRLRQFREEDADAMHQCFANPESKRFWTIRSTPSGSRPSALIRRFIDCTASYYRFWAVSDAKTDRCLGMVNYHDGHIRSRRVAIGYIIDPAHHRKGIASEAVSAMLDFCFGELGIHRVQAFIYPDYTASRKLVERPGFRCEGLLRDNLRVNGVWRDDMLFALLETDRRNQT